MRYEINARLFSAVMGAINQKEIRHYLRGFFLSAERDEIVASNGTILCAAPVTCVAGQPSWTHYDVPKDSLAGAGWLFSGLERRLARSVKTVVIDTDKQVLILQGDQYKGPEELPLKKVTGAYPNYTRIMVKPDEGVQVPAVQAFDVGLLNRCLTWSNPGPDDYLQLQFVFSKDKLGTIYATPTANMRDLQGLRIILSPCKT